MEKKVDTTNNQLTENLNSLTELLRRKSKDFTLYKQDKDAKENFFQSISMLHDVKRKLDKTKDKLPKRSEVVEPFIAAARCVIQRKCYVDNCKTPTLIKSALPILFEILFIIQACKEGVIVLPPNWSTIKQDFVTKTEAKIFFWFQLYHSMKLKYEQKVDTSENKHDFLGTLLRLFSSTDTSIMNQFLKELFYLLKIQQQLCILSAIIEKKLTIAKEQHIDILRRKLEDMPMHLCESHSNLHRIQGDISRNYRDRVPIRNGVKTKLKYRMKHLTEKQHFDTEYRDVQFCKGILAGPESKRVMQENNETSSMPQKKS